LNGSIGSTTADCSNLSVTSRRPNTKQITGVESKETIQSDSSKKVSTKTGVIQQGRTPSQVLKQAPGIEELPPIILLKVEEIEEEPNETA